MKLSNHLDADGFQLRSVADASEDDDAAVLHQTFMPTLIEAGATWRIPADRQGLSAHPITIDGVLQVDGVLVEVL